MGYKDSDPVLAKVAPDEPIFVLRAQDVLAPAHVRAWAENAKIAGAPPEKIAEALRCADLMEQWPTRKRPD